MIEMTPARRERKTPYLREVFGKRDEQLSTIKTRALAPVAHATAVPAPREPQPPTRTGWLQNHQDT